MRSSSEDKAALDAKVAALLRDLEASEESRAFERAMARRQLWLERQQSNCSSTAALSPCISYEHVCETTSWAQGLQRENERLRRQLEVERRCRSSARVRAQTDSAVECKVPLLKLQQPGCSLGSLANSGIVAAEECDTLITPRRWQRPGNRKVLVRSPDS